MSGKLDGLTFVFTGRLSRSWEEAEKMVTDLGGKTASFVSKKTSYLVAGRYPNSRYMQYAQSLDVPVLTEEEFITMTSQNLDGLLIQGDTVMGYTGNIAGRVTIPDGIRRICQYAFSGCTSLEEITLPPSVTEIGESAFSHCISLTEIHLSAKTTLSEGIFQGCDALEKIYLVGEFYTQKSGNGQSVLWGGYKSYTGEYKTVEIPKTVRSIEAPDVPYMAFPSGLQNLALIGFIEAYMRGEDVKEEVKEGYFDTVRRQRNYAAYLDHPLIIRFLTREKWIELSQIDALTEESAIRANGDDAALVAFNCFA